jgi:CDGSH-type Zn-finger protein
LCRCGLSRNKPFCDNSHESAGFVDRGAIGERGDGCEAPVGPVKVHPMKDGPLVLSGNVEMIAGSGRVAWRGTKAALCRCGKSDNKPFCDGSHRKVGFTSE